MIRARGEARSFEILLAALLVVFSQRAARAAPERGRPPPRVALFSATAGDPLAGRVAAELEVMGLAVMRVVISPLVPIEDQVRQAFIAGARAAVVADGHRTEFWIAEEGSNRVALRQELEIESSPGLESVLSLRTVEFLRVSLGLAAEPEAPPPKPPIAVPPSTRDRAEEERRFSIELASGILASTGRLGAFGVLAAGLRARLVGPLGLELAGYAPLTTDAVVLESGTVDASVWLGGGGLLLSPVRGSAFTAEAGAGVMAVVLRGAGTPSGSVARGSTEQAVGVAVYGRGSAIFRFAPRWSFRLDVTGGSTSIRRPVISVGSTAIPPAPDMIVTEWGTAFVAGLGGVDLSF